jgi:hypothetical protein
MAQSIHDYVVESLRANRKGIDQVADATEISRWTLLKIMYRQIPNPGIKSIEPLYFHFKKIEGASLRRRKAA